jgi:hypothetical protein
MSRNNGRIRGYIGPGIVTDNIRIIAGDNNPNSQLV